MYMMVLNNRVKMSVCEVPHFATQEVSDTLASDEIM